MKNKEAGVGAYYSTCIGYCTRAPRYPQVAEGARKTATQKWGSNVLSSHPHVMSWLHAQVRRAPLNVEFNAEVAIEGNLEFIKWLHQHEKSFRLVKSWSWIASFAAYEGQLEMVQWLVTNRPDMTDGVLRSAIAGATWR